MFKQLAPDPPPSYQAQRAAKIKLPLSIVLLITTVLTLQFFILPSYLFRSSPAAERLNAFHVSTLDAGLAKCHDFNAPPVQYAIPTANSRQNPRWNKISGQNATVLLKNARLFDGETLVSGLVDIEFSHGVVQSVSLATTAPVREGVRVTDVSGRYVTPGLVDMHSHHFVYTWPSLDATDDTNEVHMKSGPLTPYVRAVDSIKAYDYAGVIIASGGITTSLLLPGSANIMGGEGILVKNYLRGGEEGEPVVEELLFEHGIEEKSRRRFLKMACGENPRGVYKHTRMGNAWLFREQMERGVELRQKQDAWCLGAAAARESGGAEAFLKGEGGLPEQLELDSTVAMLRGKIGINIHCYESEDIEDMLHHSKEFGFRIQAFHHALDAWEVPELIKDSGENITIATFSEFGFYKKEAYESNLWAGKILSDHKVPVAYKSDSVIAETNAKYLMFQAATAHSFHLPEDLALQSVTSVPARSLEIDHRVGYVRPGYDADLVVWDAHPLLAGATPLQVYIDGKPTLDPVKAETPTKVHDPETPTIRKVVTEAEKKAICDPIQRKGSKIVIYGIHESFLDFPSSASAVDNLTMVLNEGQVVCLDSAEQCLSTSQDATVISLTSGYVLPGLTAVTSGLGLTEIATDDSTSDGAVPQSGSYLDAKNVDFAKYGVHLDGKSFGRARIGGVTRAITPPMLSEGFLKGVSVGIKTGGKAGLLDGGVFQDDVALHFVIGQKAKSADSTKTVSAGIAKLRSILEENSEKDNVYGKAANGTLPLVIHVENEYDILQLVKIKSDYPSINLILMGAAGAPLAAKEIAAAKIPLILTGNRDAPDTFEKSNALPGPPLTRSPASVLAEAGVVFGIAIAGDEGDPHIHNLAVEAGWAAKYAGLSKREAVDLVSRNIEHILGLRVKEEKRDFVVWEGNPLGLGASVVLSVEDGRVGTCWPEST